MISYAGAVPASSRDSQSDGDILPRRRTFLRSQLALLPTTGNMSSMGTVTEFDNGDMVDEPLGSPIGLS